MLTPPRPQVTNLTNEAVAELQRNLIPDVCSTFRYVLNPELFQRLDLGPSYEGPKGVTIDVRVTNADGSVVMSNLNDLCREQGGNNLPARLNVQRAIVRAGGTELAPFVLPIKLRVDDTEVTAVLFLEYYPMKDGVQSLPDGVEPGFDVLWQGHLLPNERLRTLAFMKNDVQERRLNSKYWKSAAGRQLSCLLDVCGDRVYGELLLPPELAVTKNKTQLSVRPPPRLRSSLVSLLSPGFFL